MHTPGPWTDDTIDGSQWGVYDKNGYSVAQAQQIKNIRGDIKQKERSANAKLIAAAPDLLAALMELKECAAYWSEYDVPPGIVDRINDVIAKATNG